MGVPAALTTRTLMQPGNHSSPRGCGTTVRGTSRRGGGGFTKQVARNVERGEAPPLLRERLEIRLDENLDGLFARINLDTNARVAEIDLVSSSVRSSNDGVRQWVWLSEIGVGLAKRLSGGLNRGVSRATCQRSIKSSSGNPLSREHDERHVRLASAPDCRRQ